jgi:biopolymer transport protein ExbB/TolQ
VPDVKHEIAALLTTAGIDPAMLNRAATLGHLVLAVMTMVGAVWTWDHAREREYADIERAMTAHTERETAMMRRLEEDSEKIRRLREEVDRRNRDQDAVRDVIRAEMMQKLEQLDRRVTELMVITARQHPNAPLPQR